MIQMATTEPLGALATEVEADIDKFTQMLSDYLEGRIPEDVFRVFRLNNGVYGQRQGGTNQMIRIKVPYGAISADQFDTLAVIANEHSRGWGHITTRQNLQFHFVELTEIPEVMRKLAAVGLTTREACGDTVRNVQGCHLAGACPYEVLDISPWAEATYRHFVRNPLSQRLPRKFKINFSGCSTDCGQAMFNDVGVVAVTRNLASGQVQSGFRVYLAGGLGTTPFPALALEDFTSREDLLPTIEAILRVFDHTGNRKNKLRARLKWVVEQLGIEEVRRQVLETRQLLPASSTWPGGIPDAVISQGDDPAGVADNIKPTAIGQGVSVSLGATTEFDRWAEANVVRGAANETVSAYACCDLGDLTAIQFRAVAEMIRRFDVDVRITNRQNLVLRNLSEDQLPALFLQLQASGMAQPGAELSRDVVACPGSDTCNLAITQSRGLAKAIGVALEEAGLAEVGGIRINISGCTNSCGQHHASDIGFFGAERRAHGRQAPGYQMLLGGHVGTKQIRFGQKALRLPARNAPEATVRVVSRFSSERQAGEDFSTWLDRVGGASSIAEGLRDLDAFPSPEDEPNFYTDFDEASPYEVSVGDSECAT